MKLALQDGIVLLSNPIWVGHGFVERFIDERLPIDTANRGGSGAIDLVKQIDCFGFIQLARVRLYAVEATQEASQ